MKYILHYTHPGDIVIDAFGGTGMTAVAAQMCGDKEVNILDLDFNYEIGERRVIVSDLAPAATFISSNYNKTLSRENFKKEIEKIISELENELGFLYKTKHN